MRGKGSAVPLDLRVVQLRRKAKGTGHTRQNYTPAYDVAGRTVKGPTWMQNLDPTTELLAAAAWRNILKPKKLSRIMKHNWPLDWIVLIGGVKEHYGAVRMTHTQGRY